MQAEVDSSPSSLFPEVAHGKLPDQVEETLTNLIVEGSLKTGEFLPSGGKLAQMLGVSLVVLREALRSLEARGLVEIQHGKGVLVKAADSSSASELLRLLMQRKGMTLADLWQARTILETEIAALAAAQASPEQIETLQEAVLGFGSTRDVATLVELDTRFHDTLIEAAGNPVLGLLMETISDLVREGRKAALSSAPPDETMEGHRAVLEAVCARDPHAARQAMRVHLQQARQELESLGYYGTS